MITKRMESVCSEETDFVTAKKLCKGLFGIDPKFSPSSARRNLFGSDDEQNSESTTIVGEFLSEATEEMAERSARVWNFDFMTETPVEGGRYLWEKVRVCDVPEWYTSTTVHRKTPGKEIEEEANVSEKENTVLVPVCTNNKLGSREAKCNSKSKLVQTSIRGWTRCVQKRRRTPTRLKRLDDTTRWDCILRGPSKSS